MIGPEELTSELQAYADEIGAAVTWQALETGRLIWLTRDDLPNLGFVSIEGLDEVQILCADFTFDGVPAARARGFAEQIVQRAGRISRHGRILKQVVLTVSVEGSTYEASRRGTDLDDWEREIAEPAAMG